MWRPELEGRVLVRIAEVWKFVENHVDEYQNYMSDRVVMILRGSGGWRTTSFGPDDLVSCTDQDLILDALAAAYEAANQMDASGNTADQFTRIVNGILNEHRIAHKFVDGELIPFASDELMLEAVEPTLRLLVSSKYKAAHDSYLKALKEISQNDAADAITDAGTALQETLTALGCKGNALGPLLKDARKNGMLAGHDEKLVDGILKFADWASADRSESGDAHKHSDATTADAWLMVHIVGALIVRLVDPVRRGR